MSLWVCRARRSQDLWSLGESSREGAEPVASDGCADGFGGREIAQAEGVGEIGEVNVVTELVTDGAQVLVHGALGAVETPGDLVPSQAMPGQRQDGGLGLGEIETVLVGQKLDKGRHPLVDNHAAGGDYVDRLTEPFQRVCLVDHTGGAGEEAGDVHAGREFLGVDEDRRDPRQVTGLDGGLRNAQQQLDGPPALHGRGAEPSPVKRVGAARWGDPQIQQDDVASPVRQLGQDRRKLLGVRGAGDDVVMGRQRAHLPEPVAIEGVVVHDPDVHQRRRHAEFGLTHDHGVPFIPRGGQLLVLERGGNDWARP
jgi:hypothetical protein